MSKNIREGRRNLSEVVRIPYDHDLEHDLRHSDPHNKWRYYPEDKWKVFTEPEEVELRYLTDDIFICPPHYADRRVRRELLNSPVHHTNEAARSLYVIPGGFEGRTDGIVMFDIHGEELTEMEQYPDKLLRLGLEVPLYLTFGVDDNRTLTFLPNKGHFGSDLFGSDPRWWDTFWYQFSLDKDIEKIILHAKYRLRKGNNPFFEKGGSELWLAEPNADGFEPKYDFTILTEYDAAVVVKTDGSRQGYVIDIGNEKEDEEIRCVPGTDFIEMNCIQTRLRVSSLFVPTEEEKDSMSEFLSSEP
jgi:hypothetical protein